MRIITLPAALALAFLLYLPLPGLAARIPQALCRLYGRIRLLFARKGGRTDDRTALTFFLLALAGCAVLLSGIHPLFAAALCAPAFGALSLVPQSAAVKRTLDSGACSGDIPGYESSVRDTCAALAPAFVHDACAPLLLLFAGTPLYLGCALVWAYAGLRAARESCPAAGKALRLIGHACERVFLALLVLCSGVVARNPLRTSGNGAQARLMSILGIANDGADTHAPVAGDIAQGVFLCCFCTVLLCALLTLALLPLV